MHFPQMRQGLAELHGREEAEEVRGHGLKRGDDFPVQGVGRPPGPAPRLAGI